MEPVAIKDEIRTIKVEASGLYKEKGSRFISIALPVSTEAEAKKVIESVKKEYCDARHHCYAYRLGINGEIWKASDDGEPSGSAGRPILGQIKSFELTDVIVVVTRYFGGILLGTGGLTAAYRNAAHSALEKAEPVIKLVMEKYRVTFPFAAMNDLMRVLKEEEVIQEDHRFNLSCTIDISFRRSQGKRLFSRLDRIKDLTVLKIK